MFLILMLLASLGQVRNECMNLVANNTVKINVGFKVGWVHDEVVEGFIVQLDKGAQLVIRPKPGPICPHGTDFADMYPYTYSKATGITEGIHTFSVRAFNTILVDGVSKKDLSPEKVIQVIGIK